MRQNLKHLVIVMLTLWTISLPQLSYSKTNSMTFNAVSFIKENNIHSIEDYAQWLKDNMIYLLDVGKDSWASPLETIQKGGGDCEDLAFLSAEVLKALGFKPLVLAHGNFKDGHVYCVFKYLGIYYTFENTNFASTEQPSLKDMAIYLAKNHHSKYLAELFLDTKEVHFIYLTNTI